MQTPEALMKVEPNLNLTCAEKIKDKLSANSRLIDSRAIRVYLTNDNGIGADCCTVARL